MSNEKNYERKGGRGKSAKTNRKNPRITLGPLVAVCGADLKKRKESDFQSVNSFKKI
jgi:hypothetical protein